MVTYIEISMKLGLLNEYKVCFGATYSQTTRFGALQKKILRGCDPQPVSYATSGVLHQTALSTQCVNRNMWAFPPKQPSFTRWRKPQVTKWDRKPLLFRITNFLLGCLKHNYICICLMFFIFNIIGYCAVLSITNILFAISFVLLTEKKQYVIASSCHYMCGYWH